MLKKCYKCGAYSEENATSCEKCGADFENTEAKSKKSSEKTPKEKKKRYIIIGGIAAAVIVVLITLAIGISAIVSNFSYEGVAKRFVSAMLDEDSDKMVSLTSDVFIEYREAYGELCDDDRTVEDTYDDKLEYIDSYFDVWVGDEYKLDYEIEDLDVIPQDIMKDEFDYYEDEYDVDVDVITEAVIAEVELQSEKDGTLYFYDVELTLVKENGSWRVFSIY